MSRYLRRRGQKAVGGRAVSTLLEESRRLVVLTDARTGTVHRVTDEAAAAGRRRGGRYVAVCGVDVLPASLTEPDRGYCSSCTSAPGQRSRASR